jgi:glyoxylase-like metal-dependent hydrolase (beta-lactamase superfamily II)
MQEIASNVYIDQNSVGLIIGLIRNGKETVLIDAPQWHGESGSWRSSTTRLDIAKPRYLIVLDTHYDRLLSLRGSDSVIVAQSEAISPIRSRTSANKSSDESPPQTENPDQISSSSSRMLPPEIIFDKQLSLHLDGLQIDLEHHPGSNYAGVWVTIPEHKIIFIGDTVVVDQPPFLAYANPQIWEEELELLTSSKYKDYQVVSSRNGLVSRDQIKKMAMMVAFIYKAFDSLKENNAPLDEWYAQIPPIQAKNGQVDLFNGELFYNRLHWGISKYYELNIREKGE